MPLTSLMPGYLRSLRRISIGSLALSGGFVVRKSSGLILAAVLTRSVGLAEFGLYCVVLVLMEFAARIAVFGTDVLIVKTVSTREPGADELTANALAWRALASVSVCVLLVAGAAWFRPSSLLPWLIATMGLGMVAQVLSDTYLSQVRGMERVHLAGYVQMLCHGVGLALALVAVWTGLGLIGVAVAYTLRAILFFLCGALLCHVLKCPVHFSLRLPVIRSLLKRGAPIAGGRVLAVLYLGAGILAMERFCGEEAAGMFAGAMKIFEACTALGMLAAIAAFPTISRLHKEDGDSLRALVCFLFRTIAWVGLPLCVLVALNAEQVLVLLFGQEFTGQGMTLVILAAAMPFSFSYVLVERMAYAANDQKRAMIIRAVGTLLSISILLTTGQRLSPPLVAMVYLMAEVTMCLLFMLNIRAYSPGVSAWRSMLPGIIASLAALTLTLLAPSRTLVPSVVFAACLAFLGLARRLLPRLNRR